MKKIVVIGTGRMGGAFATASPRCADLGKLTCRIWI